MTCLIMARWRSLAKQSIHADFKQILSKTGHIESNIYSRQYESRRWIHANHAASQSQSDPFLNKKQLEKQQRIQEIFSEWKMPRPKPRSQVPKVKEFVTRKHIWVPPLGLRYPVRPELVLNLNHNTWAPPAGVVEQLPFYVFRTHPGQGLPVYSEYRAKKTQTLTVLRRFRGSTSMLKHEMSVICDGRQIEEHQGSLRVRGDYLMPLRYWLTSLGF